MYYLKNLLDTEITFHLPQNNIKKTQVINLHKIHVNSYRYTCLYFSTKSTQCSKILHSYADIPVICWEEIIFLESIDFGTRVEHAY